MNEIILTKRPSSSLDLVKLLLKKKVKGKFKTFPDLKMTWKNASTNKSQLKTYNKLIFNDDKNFLPILYPQLLAFPLHMKILAHPNFPYSSLGSFHFKNKVVQLRPILPHEIMNIEAQLLPGKLISQGIEYDIVTKVTIDNDLIWTGTATYLLRGKFGQDEQAPSGSLSMDSLETSTQLDIWKLPLNLGRKFAKVSGDFNPIHLTKVSAHLFGLDSAVAHGICVLGQSISKLNLKIQRPVEIQNIFKGPLFLGNEVFLKSSNHDKEIRFDHFCGENERPCIQAKIKYLD